MPGTPIKLSTAAKILDLSVTHVRLLMKRGTIEQFPAGDDSLLVTLESVEKLKKEREAAQEE